VTVYEGAETLQLEVISLYTCKSDHRWLQEPLISPPSACFPQKSKHPLAKLLHPSGPMSKNKKKQDEQLAFATITPKILYFGTPVALISSINEDETPNLAPISSFWALGWTMTLGLLAETKTLENLEKRPDCVVNLPSPEMWRQVEALAPLTGQNPVPADKNDKFRFEKNKFAAGAFTPLSSDVVSALRVKECPVQMEAVIRNIYPLKGDSRLQKLGGGAAVEVEILRVHVREDFVMKENYVDPEKWQPLIYNFRHYFGLGEELGSTFRAEV
jgi:flavin reductase (DIM6/NTAB) family NADH-FMN oxidoreductase RutF